MANENMSEWSADFNVIRETVLIAKEQFERKLLNKESEFYKCKIRKDEDRAHGKVLKPSKVSASDIADYLGEVWQSGYQRRLINAVIGQLKDIKEGLYSMEAARIYEKKDTTIIIEQSVNDSNL